MWGSNFRRKACSSISNLHQIDFDRRARVEICGSADLPQIVDLGPRNGLTNAPSETLNSSSQMSEKERSRRTPSRNGRWSQHPARSQQSSCRRIAARISDPASDSSLLSSYGPTLGSLLENLFHDNSIVKLCEQIQGLYRILGLFSSAQTSSYLGLFMDSTV